MEADNTGTGECKSRSRRNRSDSARNLFGFNSNDNNLELNGVLSVLDEYDNYDGGINCRVCGKLYKSRVCFTKHLWEHTVYWEVFKGEKNHDRVLSIQAAIILWNHCQGNGTGNRGNSTNIKPNLESLLVTSPHKKDKDLNDNDITEKTKVSSDNEYAAQNKKDYHGKRKHLLSESAIMSDAFPSSAHSDVGSPAKLTRHC